MSRSRCTEEQMVAITIRNRTFHRSTRLSEVIRDIAQGGCNHSTFHCVFCRCPITGEAPTYKSPSI